ncbi:hypothetical protein [Aquimarina sp. AU58]|uniref:hypothetical protein n=1 Tax=Aquimarina sp. AU58 TaxID=1874112 RepID=UPI000D6E4E8B|nr:hypothetical protein [Aquimarina sp. AU58]
MQEYIRSTLLIFLTSSLLSCGLGAKLNSESLKDDINQYYNIISYIEKEGLFEKKKTLIKGSNFLSNQEDICLYKNDEFLSINNLEQFLRNNDLTSICNKLFFEEEYITFYYDSPPYFKKSFLIFDGGKGTLRKNVIDNKSVFGDHYSGEIIDDNFLFMKKK